MQQSLIIPIAIDSPLVLHHSSSGWTIPNNLEELVYSVICENRCKDTLCAEIMIIILVGCDFLEL